MQEQQDLLSIYHAKNVFINMISSVLVNNLLFKCKNIKLLLLNDRSNGCFAF